MSQPERSTQVLPTLGVTFIGLILVLLLSGVALEWTYRSEEAYDSLTRIQGSGFWSWIRGAHHWCSTAAILVGGLYLALGLLEGAYRTPNQLRWIVTVMAVLLVLLFQLTGHGLPWDQGAVRTAAIETGIAAEAPGFGDAQADLLRGGEQVGPATVSLWHKSHIWFLPAALLLLVAIPLGFAKSAGRGSYGFAALLLVAVLLVATALGAHPLGPRPEAGDFLGGAHRPEWYVYPLHALLRLAQNLGPGLGWLGSMLVPGLAALFLLSLPWLDRSKDGAAWVKVVSVLGLLGFGMLTLAGYQYAHPRETGVVTPTVKFNPELVARGGEVFATNGCRGCHSLEGQGGHKGPKLDGVGTRRPDVGWHISHLKSPASVTSGSTMPAFDRLPERDLEALANYLVSLKEQPR